MDQNKKKHSKPNVTRHGSLAGLSDKIVGTTSGRLRAARLRHGGFPRRDREGSDLDVRVADYGIRLPFTARVRRRTEDGTNTYEVRRERVERLLRLVDEVRIDFSRSVDGRTGRLAAAPR